ncbi:alpha/beta hydrolase family protein [Halostreptopolyspora alba]|uniref:Poly(ethylene terephthalate) hydrolase n=1 Tax=Halostreptopolyspora alba TaxID=2487137 RepID=A0A3N0EHU6_9ACTN|nr:alpha/beta hydrolase [Nocardiopsaceae bacterium YIM 96095]
MRNTDIPRELSPSPTTGRSSLGTKVASTVGVAAAMAMGMGLASPAQADTGSHERGPDPTEQALEASSGPFDTDSDSVSSLVSGFGGGTIYYPEDTSEGDFGAVALAPGYTASSTSYGSLAERIASHGFVVFAFDTNTRFDQPNSRGDQMESALEYLVEDSDVTDRIDENRQAVSGHSMGGGGTLAAADDNPDLQAAVPLTPWHLQKSWGGMQVPTMIIGAENDSVASVSSHSIPFYESLPGYGLEKAYAEVSGASHFAPNSNDDTVAKYSIAWLKRFVDNDARYDQFLCPPPDSGGFFGELSDYRDSCPTD